MIGFQSLSLSSLAVGMGVKSRIVGLVSAGTCLFLLGFGTEALGYIPKFILGGILFYTGLAFLTEWTVDAYFRLIREDYLLVMFILAIVALVGLPGRSRRGHHRRHGALCAQVQHGERHQQHALRRQPPQHGRPLAGRGAPAQTIAAARSTSSGSRDSSSSAARTISSIAFANARPTRPSRSLAYVILDFQQVSGLDTSGLVSISKLSRLAQKMRGLPSSPPRYRRTFKTVSATFRTA